MKAIAFVIIVNFCLVNLLSRSNVQRLSDYSCVALIIKRFITGVFIAHSFLRSELTSSCSWQ